MVRRLTAIVAADVVGYSRLMGDDEKAAAQRARAGVLSFLVNGRDSREIPAKLRAHKIAVYADDFYAARCIDALGACPGNGVIRTLLVHYNASEDVDRLINHQDRFI